MSKMNWLTYFVLSYVMYNIETSSFQPKFDFYRLKFFDPPRHKRQEDQWSWGYVDKKGTDENSATSSSAATELRSFYDSRAITSTTSTYDPCSPYVEPKRNYNVTDRRISEVKCLEYIWDLKIRDEKSKHTSECIKYRMNQGGLNGPHFAIGGRDTTPGEFPHMGAIGWKASIGTWIFKCGSSLISEKFVLTAAHCSRASSRDTSIADPIPQIVRLGDKNIVDTGLYGQKPFDKKIIRIINHPEYVPPKKYYDIALMELDSAVGFSRYVQPACLWNKFDVSSLGPQATLTGWGVVESGGKSISPELQAAVVDIISSEQCDELLRNSCNRNWCGIEDHQICAGKLAGGVDACQGDSGGPLLVKIPISITTEGGMHYVIGITSFGIECALPNLPGVYTRVSSFVDWIEENVWKK